MSIFLALPLQTWTKCAVKICWLCHGKKKQKRKITQLNERKFTRTIPKQFLQFQWQHATQTLGMASLWFQNKILHPRKLRWNLKIPPWKRRNIYKPPILGFHVSFQGCTLSFETLIRKKKNAPTNLCERPLLSNISPVKSAPFSEALLKPGGTGGFLKRKSQALWE